jgi:adenylate kinase
MVKSPVILFYGCPLSGKGTQSQILGKTLSIQVISSGDVFRELCKSNSPLAVEINGFMNRGELVPNELVKKVFINKFTHEDFAKGFILDGFVREPANIDLLNEILSNLNLRLACVVNLKAPLDVLLERLENRRKIIIRADDDPVIFKNRHKIFSEVTKTVMDELEKQTTIININSVGPIDEIAQQIEFNVKICLLG